MYGELTRKPNGSLSSPARNLLTNKKILKILLKFENLKIQCKQQHELNKTLLLLLYVFFTTCHYDENRIFYIEAILKHKQVACMRRKMLFTNFNYLFLFQRYSSFLNVQISQVMTSYTQPNFHQILKRISQLDSLILLNVLHNLSLTILLPWQHTGFQTSPILKAFLVTFGIPFANGASYTGYTKHINMLA